MATTSFRDAAHQILKAAGRPLSAKDIAVEALQRRLIASEGQTPVATMAARIYVDLKRNPKTPFEKVGKGLFSLRSAADIAASPQALIDRHNTLVRAALKARLHKMDAFLFEALVGDLLQRLGYDNVVVTKRSGDKGIDLTAHLTFEGITSVRTVVQVKRYQEGSNVGNDVVAQLRGSAEVDQRGLVITTSDFTKSAIDEARAANKMPVALVNGDRLVDLLIKNGIGVQTQQVTLHTLDDPYFDNADATIESATGTGKALAIWPMPGGVDSYADTLGQLLCVIAGGLKSKPKLVEWFKDTFDSVESERTANAYLNVPRTLGLTRHLGANVTLTEVGQALAQKMDLSLVNTQLARHVVGIDEIMEYLQASTEPQDAQAILDFLRENLGIDWKTFAQINYRLNWLRSIRKITKTPEGWQVFPA